MILEAKRRIDRWRARHWLRNCRAVGPGAVLEAKPFLEGEARIRIGAHFQLASTPSISHLVTGPEGSIEIGDDVRIGHGAAIASAKRIVIGDRTVIGPYAFILDTDFHGIEDRAGEARSEPIVIGRDVRIGSHVTVVRGTVLGDGVSVTAGSVVSGIVPPGARISGVPARRGRLATIDEDARDAAVEVAMKRAIASPAPP